MIPVELLRKFLIINPFGIGDVLFTTPVIRAIKDNYPDAFIGYWCNERVQSLLRNNPDINKIFALSRGDLKKIYKKSKPEAIYKTISLLFNIKKGKFDISLDFSSEHRYSLISKVLGIKRRVGFNYKKRGRFLTDRLDINGYNSKHVVEYYLDLLRLLDIEPKRYNLVLNVSDETRIKAENKFFRLGIKKEDLVIGIAPGAGASWGKDASVKHWPALKFAQLADNISKDLGAKVLILGDDSERPIADIIVNASVCKPVDLTGKTSLEELSAVISNLRVLVTNDGGPLHIAVAAGVKTVSIFGPVDDLVYGPYPVSDNHAVIKAHIPCRPCYRDFRLPLCEHERRCLSDIGVDEVFNAVRRLL